jgi:hypothetical protein
MLEPRPLRLRRLRAPLALATLLLPTVAKAWSHQATFETRIHHHEFSSVSVQNDGCKLEVKIAFDAPPKAYDSANPARSVYRFHVRTRLAEGHDSVTRVFANRGPGARVYAYVEDTTSAGCWAKEEHKIQKIDVEGCRGAGCKPEPFAD